MNAADATTKEEQLAEGIEEADIIKYDQEFKLFNTSDYIGKSKALNINYNRDMQIELFRHVGEDLELLDTFKLKDVKSSLEYEVQHLKSEQERAAKKKKREAEKAKKDKEAKKNSTESADGDKKEDEKKEEEPKKEEAADEELPPIQTPKIKISIEYSRSGLMQVTKAMAGTYRIDVDHVRKATQLTTDQLKLATQRLRW